METFDFSDYRVSKLITGYGRLIHKQLQKIALEKYGLETVFGFTDSIFIKNASLDTIERLILECKEKYHVTLEHKNRFKNTIIFYSFYCIFFTGRKFSNIKTSSQVKI